MLTPLPSSHLSDYITKSMTVQKRAVVGTTHALSGEYLTNQTRKNTEHSNDRGNVMSDLERVVKEAEIMKHLVEQLVMALNGSWGAVMQDGYLEHATEKLMTNVLLASLHEDGYIEISPGLMDDPRLFDFDHDLDVQVSLTQSGEEAQVWEELNLFEPIARQVELQ
jgi:hypothetical protein